MNRHTINDGHNTYTRISKYVAKLRFNAGKPFCIIGCNLCPGYPFALHCTVTSGKEWMEQADRYDPEKQMADSIYNPTCVSSLWKGTREETAWQLFYNNWAYYNLSHSQREEGRYAAYYIETPNKVSPVSAPVQVSS